MLALCLSLSCVRYRRALGLLCILLTDYVWPVSVLCSDMCDRCFIFVSCVVDSCPLFVLGCDLCALCLLF